MAKRGDSKYNFIDYCNLLFKSRFTTHILPSRCFVNYSIVFTVIYYLLVNLRFTTFVHLK